MGLDEFLRKERQKGRLDSAARFTLDPRKALEKLEGFQFPAPEFYLLKLIQAGVAGGAREIWVHLGRTGVKVDLIEPTAASLGDGVALCQLMHDPGRALAGTEPLHHLCLGLLGGFAESARDMSWQTPSCRLEYDGQEWRLRQESGPSHRWRFHLQRARRGLFSGLSARAAEHQLVHSRCAYSPVPIHLDNRRVAGYPDLAARSGHPYLPLRLAERLVLWERPGLAWSPDDRVKIQVRFKRAQQFRNREPGTFLRVLDGLGAGCRRAFILSSDLEGPGTIVFLRHGVVVERVEANLGCPGALAITAEPQRLDVSQFAVVRDESFQFQVDVLRSETLGLVAELHRQLEHLSVPESHGFLKDLWGDWALCLSRLALQPFYAILAATTATADVDFSSPVLRAWVRQRLPEAPE